MFLFSFLVNLFFVFSYADSATVILTPNTNFTKGVKDVGIIFLNGAFIDPVHYKPLFQEIQDKLSKSISLYVGMPSFLLDFSIPVAEVIAGQVINMKNQMIKKGMSENSPIILAGHSVGGVSAQRLMKYFLSKDNFPLAGAMLFASPLQRGNRDTDFKYPILTIGGELDGLISIARHAEAFYHEVLHPKVHHRLDRPVEIVPSLTHRQFSNSIGSFNPIIQSTDLQAEMTNQEAFLKISDIVVPFVSSVQKGWKQNRQEFWTRNKGEGNKTAFEFVEPLIEAMEMEGSERLRKQCNTDHPSPHCPFYPAFPSQGKERIPSTDTECICGVKWSETVTQQMLGGFDKDSKIEMQVVDGIHSMTDVNPIHLAHIWNSCLLPERESVRSKICTLNVTTVTQPIYNDQFDVGYGGVGGFVGATELRAKLKSRQALYQASIDKNAKIDVDANKYNIIASINQKAIDWALSKAGPRARARYMKFGEKLLVGDDMPLLVDAGPIFTYTPLKYERVPEGYRVSSPVMTTSINDGISYFFPMNAGFHYAKLLSPAWAMEFIYTHCLHLNYGFHDSK